MGGCAGCGHGVEAHGRRGYGSCRRRSFTPEGKAFAERMFAEHPPAAAERLVATALALGGMSVSCACKRFRKTTPTTANENDEGRGE